MLKRILNILYKILMVVIIVVAIMTTMSVLGYPKNYRVFVVQTGSMRPTISEGSLVLVSPLGSYHKGDIITFKKDTSNPKSVVITHRIDSTEESELGETQYVTKGDANDAPDFDPVGINQIIGRVIFNLPYAGYPVGFAKTQTGFIILVIIPATLIIYNELLVIKKEIWGKD